MQSEEYLEEARITGGAGTYQQLDYPHGIADTQVRTLMRSIAELKRKVAIATAQGKDHRRSAMIQAMRTRLREQVRDRLPTPSYGAVHHTGISRE